MSAKKGSTTVEDKVAKDRGTHESSAGGSVAGRRSCPVQTADNKEDHANGRLARVDDNATTKLVGGEGPESNSDKVAAAKKKKRGLAMYVYSEGMCRWLLGGAHERMTVPRKGSAKPAREKKSAPLATCFQQKQERNMQRTGRVGANDGETGELLGDGEDHHGEGAFLALI